MRIYSAARLSVFTISISAFNNFIDRENLLYNDLYKFVIKLSLNQVVNFFNNSKIYKNDFTYVHEYDDLNILDFINETTVVTI